MRLVCLVCVCVCMYVCVCVWLEGGGGVGVFICKCVSHLHTFKHWKKIDIFVWFKLKKNNCLKDSNNKRFFFQMKILFLVREDTLPLQINHREGYGLLKYTEYTIMKKK